MGKFIDLTGQRFGRLVVIENMGANNNRKITYLCLCDCGVEKIIVGQDLVNGATKSCGCIKKEMLEERNFIDLTNKKFGKLKIIRKIGLNNNKKTTYLCICDCGIEKVIVGQSLISGATKSCGCLKESFIAYETKKYFQNNYNCITEYRIFRNVKSGMYLPYDIYLPNKKIFIEINGLQHYEKNHFNQTHEEFDNRKYLDKLKKQYAKKNGTFIEIDLRKIETVEQAIEKIEKIIGDN